MDNIKDKTHKVAVNNLGNKQSMTNTNTTQIDELREKIDVILSSNMPIHQEHQIDKRNIINNIMPLSTNQLELLKIEAKIELTNKLFDGWIDYETNAKWKYMSIKHRDQVLSELTKQKEELRRLLTHKQRRASNE